MIRIVLLNIYNIPDFYKDSDGRISLDLDSSFSPKLTKNLEELTDINKITTDGILGFTIPATPKNNYILRNSVMPNNITTALSIKNVRVFVNSRVLPFYKLVILKMSKESYDLELRLNEDHWLIKADGTPLNKLKLSTNKFKFTRQSIFDKNMLIGYDDIEDNCIRFPLVFYGSFIDKSIVIPTNDVAHVGVPDFRPFLNVSWVIKKAFNQLGWAFHSEFLNSNYGSRLIAYLLDSEFGSNKSTVNQLATRKFAAKLDTSYFIFDSLVPGTDNRGKILPFEDKLGCAFFNNHKFSGSCICDINVNVTCYFTYPNAGVFKKRVYTLFLRLHITSGLESYILDEVSWQIYSDNKHDVTLFGSTFTINFADAQIDAGSEVYCTFHVDSSDDIFREGVTCEIKAGAIFANTPKKILLQSGDEYFISDLLNKNYSFLDFFKGVVHLCCGKLYTNYVTKEIKLLPPYKTKVYNDAEIEGFFDETTLLDLTKTVQTNSEVIKYVDQGQKKYSIVKFKGDGDEKIQELGLDDNDPYLGIRILNDATLEEGNNVFENPFFEPTMNDYYNSVYSNNVNMPFMSTQEKGLNFDIEPRILYWFGNTTQYIKTTGTPDIAEIRIFGTTSDDIPFAFQLSDAFVDLSLTPLVINVAYGDRVTPIKKILIKKDLFTFFWKRYIFDSFLNYTVNALAHLSQADFFGINFRNLVKVNVFGRDSVCILKSIDDFSLYDDISTPINLNVIKPLSEVTELEIRTGYDCNANLPELIITKVGDCFNFSMGGSNSSPVEDTTFEYKYKQTDIWVEALSLCNPISEFDVRLIVSYEGDCDDVVIRKYVSACINDISVNVVYNEEDNCFVITPVLDDITSDIDTTLIEYSFDDGVTYSTYTTSDCVDAETYDKVKVKITITFTDGCDDIINESDHYLGVYEDDCEGITSDVDYIEFGLFERSGAIPDTLIPTLDLIQYKYSGDEVWKTWDEECIIGPGAISYRRIIFFCNDKCPTFCSDIKTSDGYCSSDIDVELLSHTITGSDIEYVLKVLGCTFSTINWQVKNASNEWIDLSLHTDTVTINQTNMADSYRVVVKCSDDCFGIQTFDLFNKNYRGKVAWGSN